MKRAPWGAFALACAVAGFLWPALLYAAEAACALMIVIALVYVARKHRPRALRASRRPAQVRVRAAVVPPQARAVHECEPEPATCACGNRATALYEGVPACEGCAGDDHTPVPTAPDPDAGPGATDMTEFEERL